MKILFIGGTGVISSACAQLAIDQGHTLTILNRGHTPRPLPRGAVHVTADIRDRTATAAAIGAGTFDVVVEWVAYTPEHIAADLAAFTGRVGQYIFISSASAYQRPAPGPITEDMPLANPVWRYSQQKIACESALWQAYESERFPVTIVRPSHTYDATLIPFRGRWTVLDGLLRARPRRRPIVVHGDGTSLWTLTHHRDFAAAFNGLFGLDAAIGEAFHITSDEWLTWNEIARLLGAAVGVEPEIVHVPSETIARYDPEWGASLLGDKAHSTVFDNSKIKRLVPDFAARIPFADGAAEIAAYYLSHPAAQQVDPAFDALLDCIIAAQRAVAPPPA
jgi:nucleoside-diphosphate-sugar epimerase